MHHFTFSSLPSHRYYRSHRQQHRRLDASRVKPRGREPRLKPRVMARACLPTRRRRVTWWLWLRDDGNFLGNDWEKRMKRWGGLGNILGKVSYFERFGFFPKNSPKYGRVVHGIPTFSPKIKMSKLPQNQQNIPKKGQNSYTSRLQCGLVHSFVISSGRVDQRCATLSEC